MQHLNFRIAEFALPLCRSAFLFPACSAEGSLTWPPLKAPTLLPSLFLAHTHMPIALSLEDSAN